MSESAAVASRTAEPAGARPESQGARLDALAQAQLSGALRLVSSDAEAQIERFCDPQLLASGKVNIISLEAVQKRFGDRWPGRKDQVFDFADRVLERSLGERGVSVRVSDMDYFIVHPDLSRMAGQAACLRYLREILGHFLGHDKDAGVGVLQVTRISHGRLQAEQVDFATAAGGHARRAAAPIEDGAASPGRTTRDSGNITTKLVNRWTPFVAVDRTPAAGLGDAGAGLRTQGLHPHRLPDDPPGDRDRPPPRSCRRSSRWRPCRPADIMQADLATITRGSTACVRKSAPSASSA